MSDTPTKIIVDCSTGVVAEVPLTGEEIAQGKIDAAQAEADRAEKEAIETAKAEAKLTAHAKLNALGLTGEEISAIIEQEQKDGSSTI